MQLAILRRLEAVELQPATLTSLAGFIPQSNQEQLALILGLFSRQARLSDSHQRQLSDLLLSMPEEKSEKIGGFLEQIRLTDRPAKKNLSTYKASRKQ
jgi:hypothetical protein